MRPERETEPVRLSEPTIRLTYDPRESITWPKGWVTSDGVHVRLAPSGSLYPFEYFAGGWVLTENMGCLPHGRVT